MQPQSSPGTLVDSAKQRLRSVLIPATRGYMRYAPTDLGKRALWTHLIAPRLAWASYEYEAQTLFGGRLRGNTADLIQRCIYYFGTWEPHITQWISASLRPGDGFIDVGANIGYYSLLAASLVGPDGPMVAIDASPGIFLDLQANLRRNGARVRTVHAAVSDRHCRLPVFRSPPDNAGSTTTIRDGIIGAETFVLEGEVEGAPLGELLTEEEVRRARIIKIDVEGAELAVARGMAALFPRLRPDCEIILEVGPHRLIAQGETVDTLLRVFTDAGYFPYNIPNDYSTRDYLPPVKAEAPKRLRKPVTDQCDVIFSRRDVETLPTRQAPRT
jgi:FkbM family methyltransferase